MKNKSMLTFAKNKILTTLIQFSILSIFVIGNFSDNRLVLANLNISYFLTVFYLGGLFFILISSRFNKRLLMFFMIFYLIILGQTLINWYIWGININNNYSLNKFFILSFITLPMCLYISTLDSNEKLNYLARNISLVGGFLFAISIFKLVLSGSGFGEERISVLGGGPIVFSRWIGVFCLAIFYDNINIKKFKYLILFLCIILMLYSGSRGPIIFLLFIITFIRPIKIKYFISSLILASIMLLINYDIIINFIDDVPVLGRLFGLTHGSSLIDGSSTTMRLFLYNDSFQLFKDNIFGYGIGNFSIYSKAGQLMSRSAYPHNFLLEICVEHGIFAFIFVISSILYFLKNIIRLIQINEINKQSKMFFGIWLFCFLNSLVSGDLSDSRILIFFSCILFMYFEINRPKRG